MQPDETKFGEDEDSYKLLFTNILKGVYSERNKVVDNQNGSMEDIVSITRDLTEHNRVAGEMPQLSKLNLMGQMAASIAHEIRNPMTTVRGFLQLFRKKTTEIEREYFDLMIEEIDRANSIITECLSLAKDKSLKLTLGNLNCAIAKLYPQLNASALESGHNIQLEIGDIPDIFIDEQEIRQLILNLVLNGREATPSGGTITIKTSFMDESIILAVQDTGCGIPKDMLSNLGTPFVTTKEYGTGLGMPVCYKIAHLHGANIDVKTSKEGTTFFVRFPVNKPI